MTLSVLTAAIAAAFVMSAPASMAKTSQPEGHRDAFETRIPTSGASLYARVVGQGEHTIIVLHGGPDFDHQYFLPDLDRFGDALRLIYYDQRGRGRSADDVRPEDVTLASEMADLDTVRAHFGLESVALLGHSWGAVLALEYAMRHPARVSHLVLMNPGAASAEDLALVRQAYLERIGDDMERQRAIVSSTAYQAGDPEAVAARYRIHFKPALKRAGDYERLMVVMKAAFTSQGPEGIVKARAIEDRLMHEMREQEGHNLLPRLSSLRVPTLVVAGVDDVIPVVVAEHIAEAIPGARFVAIDDCGHFAYLECPGEVRSALDDFLGSSRQRRRRP